MEAALTQKAPDDSAIKRGIRVQPVMHKGVKIHNPM